MFNPINIFGTHTFIEHSAWGRKTKRDNFCLPKFYLLFEETNIVMSTMLYPGLVHSTEERGINLTLQGGFVEEVILELGIEG